MVRTRMTNLDRQSGMPMIRVMSPELVVIHQHPYQHSVSVKQTVQVPLNDIPALVQTDLQSYRKPGTIVQYLLFGVSLHNRY